jgi:hypothetical protein
LNDRNSERLLSSSTGDGDSCNSKSKHDGITVPKPKLFVSNVSLQDRDRNPIKIVVSWRPCEDGFCDSVAKHDGRN